MPDTEIQTGKFTVQRLPSLAAPATVPPPALLAATMPPPVPCANCAAPLAGPFCAQCGQHVADYHRSVWRFVADFFDNAICWDNKLFRTLGPLCKRPGFLTREFMQGHRVRYVHPLRLFLFTSAVCLTLLQFGHDSMGKVTVNRKAPSKKGPHFQFQIGNKAPLVPDSESGAASPSPSPSPTPSPPPTATPDSDKDEDEDAGAEAGKAAVKNALAGKLAKGDGPGNVLPPDFGERITRAVETGVAKGGGPERLGQAISDGIRERLSWVALALLPVFALLLRAVYWREDCFYFAHLIFSLHYHTFLLLFWTAYTGAEVVAAHLPLRGLLEWFLPWCLWLPPIYLFIALRLIYGESKKRTVMKVLVLGALHLLAIAIGVASVGASAYLAATK